MPRHSSSILDLARRGAEVRWRELQSELSDLLKAFPSLGSANGGAGAKRAKVRRARASSSDDGVSGRTIRRGKMSRAARLAVSLRMKKYWAARRAAKAKGRKTLEK
jgi:hypothetical protein